MRTGLPVVAVFDIGKTNKKVLVFDSAYQLVKEEMIQPEETFDEDGFPCEDINSLANWVQAQYQALKTSREFDVRAVNFSTYGASLVHLDAAGIPAGYLYNYLKPYPPELQTRFASKYGEAISVETCSPLMGHLNAGLQLYWLKQERAALFDRIHHTLHFPQYLSYLLTGKKFAEMTNVGCHSAMWHFQQMRYHDWLQQEGIAPRLSAITPGSHVVPVPGEAPGDTIAIGIGLHDSSAAIIPYLRTFTEPFLILSTGTWTVSLNPFSQHLPTAEELAAGCVSYLTYEGQPVKTSMLFAGHDHDEQAQRIAHHFQLTSDFFKSIKADPIAINLYWQQAEESGKETHAAIRSSATAPCFFHSRDLSLFPSAAAAYHQLLADLVYQQSLYTMMVLRHSPVKQMYVDGGFCKNAIYMQYIANAFPGLQVYATTMVQGTALGAALAIHAHWNNQSQLTQLLQVKKWEATTNRKNATGSDTGSEN